MEKHFNYFFPPETYIPLELIKIENKDIIIERLRYEKLKNSFTHTSTVVKNNIYSQLTEDEGVICASITIPYGKILEIVKRCNDNNDEIISSVCGPIKTMHLNQGLFSSECILRSKDIEGISSYINLNNELIDTQRKLVIRLYSEPLFNNFKFTDGKYKDIELGVELEYPNFLRYQSMIIPYGLYLDNAGELIVNQQDPTIFTMKSGKLYGPCILSDISKLYVYYKQSYIHGIIKDEGSFEKQLLKDDIKSIVEKIIPEKTVVITNKRLKVKVKLSHYMYKSLKPLLGVYLLSKCLGDDYTKVLESECPWKISETEAEQIIMYWLVKTNGDYSYIASIYNNPKYKILCGKILSKYSKITQY
jgi:hypothetical protein